MWKTILRHAEFADNFPCPSTDDELDAGVDYILGTMISRGEVDQCTIIGDARDGAFLVVFS